jgi:6-phosphofructokinase
MRSWYRLVTPADERPSHIHNTAQAALKVCDELLQLDGLVVVGGDDSNTNAAYLAEYFAEHNSRVRVLGVPKTIDGEISHAHDSGL